MNITLTLQDRTAARNRRTGRQSPRRARPAFPAGHFDGRISRFERRFAETAMALLCWSLNRS